MTSSGALEALVALAVIAAALLDPLQTAVAVAGLVGPVLVEAGFHAALARGVFCIFGIDPMWVDGKAGRDWGWGRRGCCRLRRWCGGWRRCRGRRCCRG